MIQLINYGVEREFFEAAGAMLRARRPCNLWPATYVDPFILIQHPIPQPNGHCRLILHLIKAEPAYVFAANDAHE